VKIDSNLLGSLLYLIVGGCVSLFTCLPASPYTFEHF
jgi:hypothetical protein